jgi:amino acid adenylation domain-containing protein
MSSAVEQMQVIGVTAPGDIDRCVPFLFEAQAERTPNATAVISEEGHLTYRELNARANQLAHHLRSSGVAAETLVGISVRRSLDMIVGMLGILKAGGAYVPLDPTYPKGRVASMLGDSAARVVVSQKAIAARLPKTEAAIICIDSEWETISRNSRENPISLAKPESLAYVIYTSGSTGKPKGVLVEHRSLANYIEAAADRFTLGPEDRVLQFASISFDASAEEIYTCLVRGATLVLRSDSMLDSVSSFLQQCRERCITVLDLPTAFWHELTATLDRQALSLPESIRLVIIGGERALPDRVAAWLERVPSAVRLLNTYGPTEATIAATVSDLSEPGLPIDGKTEVSVGRPIANVRTYVLDRQLQPVPTGATGELCIGGVGLARGYLNRPDLTRQKFIPDPFSDEPGARLYRTGDLARYLPDGSLQLAGRIDDQVKINGFRIELGEIEAALRCNPDLRDAIVIAREDRPGNRRLIAYVVLRRGRDSVTAAELRDQMNDFLKNRLPSHMLPSAFVALEVFPLSVNGKVDRNALPRPEPLKAAPRSYVRPRDPLEKHLVEIWEEILNVRPIGIKDNFFDLGGHSLLSVRMIDRIEQAFDSKLPMATLFKEATVEHVAATLLNCHKAGPRPEIVEIQKGGSKRPFFFLHGDFNGGGFYCLNLARGLGDQQPFFALQPHGLDGGPVPSTIEAMADRHLRSLREVQPKGPYLLGGYCNGGTIAFELARRLKSQGERVDRLVLLCASANNARYRPLETMVSLLGRVQRLGPEERLRHFLALRERIVRLAEIKNYYRSRLAELSRMETRDKLTFFRQKAGRSFGAAGLTLVSAVKNGKSQEVSQQSGVATTVVDDRRERVGAAYGRAMLGYVPKSYPGRVTLLWPRELPLDDPNDPSAGWSKVAARVDVHQVGGGHITCVTSNLHNVAETLRSCLEATTEQ